MRIMDKKVVLITGASGGIGKATVQAFAEQGATVILCDICKDKLNVLKRQMEKEKHKVVAFPLDVTKEGEIQDVLEKVIWEFGRIDVLINCAGIGNAGKIIDTDENTWNKVMDVNLKSVFFMSKYVAKIMIQRGIKGNIVSISSQNSKIAEYANGVYSCSKAAVNSLTQVMAQEFAEYGINVNCICPGYVNTEMMSKAFRERGPIEGKKEEEYKKELCEKIPLKRMAEPKDIANVVLFLASQKAEYITGIALTVSGGTTLI